MEQNKLDYMATNHSESKVVSGPEGFNYLRDYITSNQFERVVVVLDQNTEKHCLPSFLEYFSSDFFAHFYVLPQGESAKTMDSVLGFLSFLSNLDTPVNSLLISVGGGAISDVCGFVASIYKRGLKVAHVPTSLIGMTDAAYGGKTGVNFLNVKNLVGTFYFPDLILLHHRFLKTLPSDHLQSGYGEMLKYALLIGSDAMDQILWIIEQNQIPEDALIQRCLDYKKQVVAIDPFDKKERYFLNLGHTLGHAFESAYMVAGLPVTHGWAVARGIYVALSVSVDLCGFPPDTASKIKEMIQRNFSNHHLPALSLDSLPAFLKQDKKNNGKGHRMVLLKEIGEPQIVDNISTDFIMKALS